MMTDLNTLYQSLGKDVYRYLDQIAKLLLQELMSKGIEKFSTNNGDFFIKKINSGDLNDVNFGDKVHLLFSPNGCEISATLKIAADTYVDQSKNAYTQYTYLIDFNPIRITYLYDKEKFKLNGELKMKNIRKEHNFPY